MADKNYLKISQNFCFHSQMMYKSLLELALEDRKREIQSRKRPSLGRGRKLRKLLDTLWSDEIDPFVIVVLIQL